MFVDKDSIIINGINQGPFLVQAEFGYNKLWAKDSRKKFSTEHRHGTLIGIFPKLILYYRKLTKQELHLLAPVFDSASQTTQYYDDNKGQMVTMQTYTGDWKVINKSIGINQPFNISFIAKKRRG